jgi:hypothetical protein
MEIDQEMFDVSHEAEQAPARRSRNRSHSAPAILRPSEQNNLRRSLRDDLTVNMVTNIPAPSIATRKPNKWSMTPPAKSSLVPDMPLYQELLNYVPKWAAWALDITDEDLREKSYDKVMEVLLRVWKHAIAKRVIPSKAPRGWEHMTDEEIAEGMVDEELKDRAKYQELDAARMVVINTKRAINTEKIPNASSHPITAGELAENNIDMTVVQERIKNKDFGDKDAMIQAALAGLDGGAVSAKDFLDRRHNPRGIICYNPRGRNLFFYSIWELLRSDRQLIYLRTTLVNAQAAEQNDQSPGGIAQLRKHIAREVRLNDILTALCLELNPNKPEEISDDGSDDEMDENKEGAAVDGNGDATMKDGEDTKNEAVKPRLVLKLQSKPTDTRSATLDPDTPTRRTPRNKKRVKYFADDDDDSYKDESN